MGSDYVALFEGCFPGTDILNCLFVCLFDAFEIFPSCIIHHRKFEMSEKGVFPLQRERRRGGKGELARSSTTGTFPSRQNGFRDVKDLKLL